MNQRARTTPPKTRVGALLRQWRMTRRMSQLELATQAEVSTRHISFLENGRARPSREMILALSSVLDLPLRERNRVLIAGGFTPAYRETQLDDPSMAQVRKTLELMLAQAEPFSALVMDSRGDLLMANAASQRLTPLMLEDPGAFAELGPPNILRMLLHPAGMVGAIANWESVARAIVGRTVREAEASGDAGIHAILDEVLRYPGVPRDLRRVDPLEEPPLLVPIHFRKGPLDARVFSTVTTLGTALDVTLHELRIEVFYPADDASEQTLRALS